MSLVTPGVVRKLYDEAKAQQAQEHETTTFWVYLFNKRYFVGEAWFVASQKPPSSAIEDRRRIDLNINYYNGATDEVKVVVIVEGKRTSTQPAVIEQFPDGHVRQAGRNQTFVGISTPIRRKRQLSMKKSGTSSRKLLKATLSFPPRTNQQLLASDNGPPNTESTIDMIKMVNAIGHRGSILMSDISFAYHQTITPVIG
ncbi:hypothetical protein K490DRAFT_58522 [Saccharata proteae CBS 121410]|uniref:Uncharacterized protein n=1 Tax=Saccharata proteae CBS 121410 TaxID=1314787 RepID=A0A9P4HSH7_9PEZI|nr:hypothetical protein K490DRAFT_58522 [Saccharata proteae CBS 121410]